MPVVCCAAAVVLTIYRRRWCINVASVHVGKFAAVVAAVLAAAVASVLVPVFATSVSLWWSKMS